MEHTTDQNDIKNNEMLKYRNDQTRFAIFGHYCILVLLLFLCVTLVRMLHWLLYRERDRDSYWSALTWVNA